MYSGENSWEMRENREEAVEVYTTPFSGVALIMAIRLAPLRRARVNIPLLGGSRGKQVLSVRVRVLLQVIKIGSSPGGA